MYKLNHYTEKDQQTVIAFMKENDFAMVTGFGKNYPVATQIPLEIEEKEGQLLFRGHFMKKTDHHIAFEKNNNVLVVFTGPHCFVSASWYDNPQTASTWDYMAVHAKGKIIFTDEEGTYQVIKNATNKYEGEVTIAAFNKIPQDYIAHQLKAIIGFTIEVETIENVFKLSQNKTREEQLNIIAHLKKRGDENSIKIAEEIEHRLN